MKKAFCILLIAFVVFSFSSCLFPFNLPTSNNNQTTFEVEEITTETGVELTADTAHSPTDVITNNAGGEETATYATEETMTESATEEFVIKDYGDILKLTFPLEYKNTLFYPDTNYAGAVYSIALPQFYSSVYESTIEIVNEYFAGLFKGYKDYEFFDLSEEDPDYYTGAGINTYELSFSYDLVFDRYLNVRMEEYYYYKGAVHPISNEYFDVIDIAEATRVTLESLFGSDSLKYKRRICDELYYEFVNKNIHQNLFTWGNMDKESKEDFIFNLCADYLDDNSFYLKESSIVFIFNPYDIAPYSAGLIEVEIPYERLNDIMTNPKS